MIFIRIKLLQIKQTWQNDYAAHGLLVEFLFFRLLADRRLALSQNTLGTLSGTILL
jgi:hypothetical protein